MVPQNRLWTITCVPIPYYMLTVDTMYYMHTVIVHSFVVGIQKHTLQFCTNRKWYNAMIYFFPKISWSHFLQLWAPLFPLCSLSYTHQQQSWKSNIFCVNTVHTWFVVWNWETAIVLPDSDSDSDHVWFNKFMQVVILKKKKNYGYDKNCNQKSNVI